jgi:hypothetical protein
MKYFQLFEVILEVIGFEYWNPKNKLDFIVE